MLQQPLPILFHDFHVQLTRSLDMGVPFATAGEVKRAIGSFDKQALRTKKDGHTGAEDRKRKCTGRSGKLQAIGHTWCGDSIERENKVTWKCDIGSSRENTMNRATLRYTPCHCCNISAIGRGCGQSPSPAHKYLLNGLLWFADKDTDKTPQQPEEQPVDTHANE